MPVLTILNELTTILDYVRWGVTQMRAANLYFGHGTDNAWDETIYLILHALHLPQTIDRAVFSAALTMAERQAVVDIVQRRIVERKPAAYLTNSTYFAGLEFYVDERVLIPRSPIAELIEKQFTPWIDTTRVHKILDIGTGSGCIAIACAEAFPDAVVDAVDISAQALEVAKINVEKYGLAERVHLWKSDLFAGLPSGVQYDIIVSNPPYVADAELKNLPPEYYHEPHATALAAGADGLEVVDRLLREVKRYLAPGGILVIEVGNSATTLVERYPDLPLVWLEFERGESEVFLFVNNINF